MQTFKHSSTLGSSKSKMLSASVNDVAQIPMQKRLNFEAFELISPARVDALSQFSAPLFGSYVPAGFPSPTQERF